MFVYCVVVGCQCVCIVLLSGVNVCVLCCRVSLYVYCVVRC